MLLSALLAGCEKRAPSLPAEYLGRWRYVDSSGGLDGSGMGDEARGHLVFQAGGTLILENEQGTEQNRLRFTVARAKTIFSSEEQWILAVEGESDLPEVIQLSQDGLTLSLSQNAYDGIARTYARVR